MSSGHSKWVEAQVESWRRHMLAGRSDPQVKIAALENSLSAEIATLTDAGLETDEAFVVAIKRLGTRDPGSRAFLRANSNHLWTQLLLVPSEPGGSQAPGSLDAVVAVFLATAAAAAIKAPSLFGLHFDEGKDDDLGFYLRNASLLVMPFVVLYFARRRRLQPLMVLPARPRVSPGQRLRERLPLRQNQRRGKTPGAAFADRTLVGFPAPEREEISAKRTYLRAGRRRGSSKSRR